MDDFTQRIILILLDKLAVGLIIIAVAYLFNRLLERLKGEQSRQKEYEALRGQTALNHLQRQIGELYGPLLGLIQYGNAINEVEFAKSSKEDHNLHAIESYFAEKYYIPLNKQISDLISSKLYLLVSNNIPDSFQQFLSHAARLECLNSLYKDRGIGSWDIENPYPDKFKEEVKGTLDSLKRRHEEYLSSLKLAPNSQ